MKPARRIRLGRYPTPWDGRREGEQVVAGPLFNEALEDGAPAAFPLPPFHLLPRQYKRRSVRSSNCPPLTAGDAFVRLSSPSMTLWARSWNFGLAATT